MNWLRALLLGVAALCWIADAAAHGTLLSATPADGAALDAAPAEIVLRFDEPVAPLAMRLTDDAGSSVLLTGAARAEGQEVRVALPAIGTGTFIFSWRVVSADSHPVGGAIAFAVGQGTTASQRTATPAGATLSSPAPALISARALRDLLLLAASGAAMFAVCVGAFPRQRAVLCFACTGAALASVLEWGMQGAALLELTLPSIDAFRAIADTTAAASSAGILVGVTAIVLGALTASPRASRAWLAVGGLTAPASLALTGHAATAQPVWLSMTTVAAHALVAAFWVGSLFVLRLIVHSGPATMPALRRFSAHATPAVAVLLAAGTLFAAMQIGSIDQLTHSRYGQWVLAKAALLAALLAIAARNRFVLMPRLERADAGAPIALARAITAELALVVLVIAATAVLSRTPPRTDVGLTTALHGTLGFHGQLTVSPARAGRNSIVADLRDRDGRPLDPDETTLRLANARAGIEAIERPLKREAAGRFRYEGDEIAFPGSWTFSIDGRVGDFERFTLQAVVEVR